MLIMDEKFVEPTLKNLIDFGKVPTEKNQYLTTLGKPHVDSFNEFIHRGLALLAEELRPIKFKLADETLIEINILGLRLERPQISGGGGKILLSTVFPTECRQRKTTYAGTLLAQIEWSVNGIHQNTTEKNLGPIPIMVMSDRCNLAGLAPPELVAHKEHEDEWGGYFIVKGNERLVRMLLVTRRNYPVAVKRRSWKQRGALFSEFGVLIRSVASDHTSINNVLHFVTDGSAKLMVAYNKALYFMPLCLILKCLRPVSDHYIFQRLMEGMEDDTYYRSCVMNMLQIVHGEGLHTYDMARVFIGKMFRIRMYEESPFHTDEELCDLLMKSSVLIHLETNEEKFDLLIMMTQKLFSFVQGKCCDEGVDAVMFQEVLTGGQIYQLVLKNKLESWLRGCKIQALKKDASARGFSAKPLEMVALFSSAGQVDRGMENFLATGNAPKVTTLGIQQETGLTIVAENINRMRYMSHFRSIHRGSFFVEMKTTEARQLLPDAWGFVCPVHTPDGTPCGLLNHLTKNCEVTTRPSDELISRLPSVLLSLGVLQNYKPVSHNDSCFVLLDGKVIGRVRKNDARNFVRRLRLLKVLGKEVPSTLEIASVPIKDVKSEYPGVFLFTTPFRLMRPVVNLHTKNLELIGTFEQVYMDICLKASEAYPGKTTHQEISQTDFLSNLACLIPMPDCNQSPRNMYQCQMGKQTMGTPSQILEVTSDTKLYRLLTPGSPLFRTAHYDHIKLDDFAMGTNAIVAVISYTGYDMEDAMIINKSSYDRGFAHGTIHKTVVIDLEKDCYFERDPSNPALAATLDTDGLPFVGCMLEEHAPEYCYFNSAESRYVVVKFHGKELAHIDNVRQCVGPKPDLYRAIINIRIPRNPSVGDKFASRAGQKGICSQLWPVEDLPFTDSGLVPDIVFNPHGFPSRMTIAMMIEMMAGKSAAVHGLVHDATPFRFDEDNTAIEYFQRLLIEAGYNYHCTERMYSGVDGREMKASIFFGIVYYQRLRHMVLDKWQVRSTGPVDMVTMQPIKGRSKGGGVRFGEMERDALISHGASILLQDRLFDCSDRYSALICQKCHSLLSSSISRHPKSGAKAAQCRQCNEEGEVHSIEVPYIFRYMLVQLASVNIHLKVITEQSC